MRYFPASLLFIASLSFAESAPQQAPPPAVAPAASEVAAASCVRLHEEMASCAETFTTLMVDLRARYEPGFAKKLAAKGARAEILKAGTAETRRDGGGPIEPRRARCQSWVKSGPSVPADEPVKLAACWALDTCAKKAACVQPMLQARLAARASEGKWQDAASTKDAAPR